MDSLSELIESLVDKSLVELHQPKVFEPGKSNIPVTGKVFGTQELVGAVTASLDFWLTAGPYTEQFESAFAKKSWNATLIYGEFRLFCKSYCLVGTIEPQNGRTAITNR